MRPRAVDWALFLLTTIEFLSGLGSFLVGRPEGRLIFVLHSILGLAILLLQLWKLRRVYPRVIEPRRWQLATVVSVLTTIAVAVTIGTGVMWTIAQRPLSYPNGMILHTTAAIVLVIFSLWHMLLRFKPLHRRDLQDRRTVVRFFSLFAFGTLLWGTQEGANRLLQTPGAQRRFTGSREASQANGNGAFPVTMWMFDNPAPVDGTTWQLQVSGAVENPIMFTYADLTSLSQHEQEASIDCTGGWYATQRWQGVRVGDILEQAIPSPNAAVVSFISITGYRWSLPLAEAVDTLLALRVGDEPLSHGHGAPVRLVAPGRRGFQWVKWVSEIRILTAPDHRQWGIIFTSGLRPIKSNPVS